MSDRDEAYEYDNDEDRMETTALEKEVYFGNSTQRSRHMKFLDLTNGTGGERPKNKYDDDVDEVDDDDGGDLHVDGGMETSIAAERPIRGMSIDPSTPGKVVEAGQEQTGRWTKEEHQSFLSALQMYGKEWKKVAAKVKTRTVVQTRTHAQKYFQKLHKAMEQSGLKEGDVTHVEMGVAPEAKKASKPKKRGTPSIAAKPRQGSLTSAAHLISNLSGNPPMHAPPGTSATRSEFNGASSASVPSSSVINLPPQQPPSIPHYAPRHGFSTGGDSYRQPYSGFGQSVDSWTASSTGTKSAMQIVAPDPAEAAKRGKFPEPSPAACGKRKLAEIAAARMLAGVAAGGVNSKPLLSSAMGVDQDGDATPPPSSPKQRNEAPRLPLSVPDPPLVVPSAAPSSNKVRKGLSLQIVNPETLGVTYEEQQKRRRQGEASPVTPWDGQLEALVSEKKKEQEKQDSDDGTGIQHAFPQEEGCPHPVCGPGHAYGRTPLHRAVCEMDINTLENELSIVANTSERVLLRRDEAGFCPLHSACALKMLNRHSNVQRGIVRKLLSAGADSACVDDNGNTPLHWAARAGDKDVAEMLLLKNCPQDAKNNNGETPLHWAMRGGRVAIEVVAVLLDNGVRPSILNKEFKRPVDVAADGFDDVAGNPLQKLPKDKQKPKRLSKDQKRILRAIIDERIEVRAQLLKKSPQSRTLVLHHPECLEHTPKSATDWEAPDRVTSIMDRLFPSLEGDGSAAIAPIQSHEVTISKMFERASLDLLSRVHSTEYLAFVNDLSKDLERQQKEAIEDESKSGASDQTKAGALSPPVVPFTPMVQRSMIKIEESKLKLGAHSDTSFSVGSLRAARRAAGAVQHAVDCVLVGRHRNAFCVVRPPGHHAGVNGLLDGGESCGFCIFNNVAAGALHAISDERLLCDRCAIVDIDVHHGNGTDEIVRKYHDPTKLFFFSIHLYDNDKKKRNPNSFQYKFYPGTGSEDDVAFNIVNVAITPLWKEEHLAHPVNTHNTRQKAKQKATVESNDESDARESSGRGSDAESESVSRDRIPPVSPPRNVAPVNSGRVAYRQAITNRLLPALRAFNPDLILISAGFDAAKGDVGNARHERSGEKVGLDLDPEDYAWTTSKILEVADICCHGRVVSVLEGGYGRTPPENSGTQALDRSGFAQCAVRHLHSLVDPYDVESRFSN